MQNYKRLLGHDMSDRIELNCLVANDRILQLANTPRSLTVQTPNPVDDAAKLINDMSRGQVVAGGM
ncbi:hypothetical protein [Nostoc sp. TCL240-02]|uniref:hypothetical protein n=1 Tax=Nostoc sp. TCL240-02 TaxID=2572090 RepID=UPI00157FA8B4|nr:hypothetical protein [Nostoc sp. TCL240-02]QKQ75602.1 hypothetical protein FBB35_21980 [Nostoc sp. TCL240-02]